MFADHLVAHRGYPARLPENTLPSIEAALLAGAHYLEIDVQLSQDEEVVLFHDRNLVRLCGQPGAVHDYPWRELQHFNVHGVHPVASTVPATAISHLAEVVTLLTSHPEVKLFVELKRISLETFGVEAMVQRVLPLLRPIENQTIVISYSFEALQHVRQVTNVPIGVVIDNWSDHNLPAVQKLKSDYLFCQLTSLPPEGELVCEDSQLVLFECTDPKQALNLLQRGAKLIETFAIGEMLSAMAAMSGSLEKIER
jgi:glycerophosphoryl diester phosphodiesterase